jgi:hypothetical protein
MPSFPAAAVAGFLICLILLIGCVPSQSKKGGTGGAKPQVPIVAAGSGTTADTGQARVQNKVAPVEMIPSPPNPGSTGRSSPPATKAVPAQKPATPAPNLPPGPSLPSTPRYFNVAAHPGPIVASDFRIGSLEDLVIPGKTPAALIASLSTFLNGLVKGKIEESAILPDRKVLVDILLEDFLPQADSTVPRPVLSGWRLGTIRIEGDQAIAALSLFGEAIAEVGNKRLPPRADGEIRARFEKDSWFVEDFSATAADLFDDRPLPDPPFEPQVGAAAAPSRGN